MFFDTHGRLTDAAAGRHRTAGASDPETCSTPVTGYGEFEGLGLPARGRAIYQLPGGDFDYVEVAITGMRYNTGVAPPEGRAR